MDNNVIEKRIELAAPMSKVWQAISDSKQFGQWFRVKFTEPFEVGHAIKGMITYPGYEHLEMEIVPQKIEPETFFSFTWHPYAINPEVDYSNETPTLVEFSLQLQDERSLDKTLLTIKESGFENLSAARRDEAFRMNDGGWTAQSKNIEEYVLLTEKTI